MRGWKASCRLTKPIEPIAIFSIVIAAGLPWVERFCASYSQAIWEPRLSKSSSTTVSTGNPRWAAPNAGIRFNVSHSQEIALIAVAHGREVGVDIEFVRQLTDQEQLLTSNFSSREVAAFRLLPRQQQQAAFFAGWTRKEAYLKACGEGLSIPLDSFAVSLGPDDPAALLEVRHDPMEPARWGMANLSVAPGYAGALVAEGGGWRFDYADWDGAICLADHG